MINFASSSGQLGFEGNASYNATKEAIRALTRTAAREWGTHKVTVNVVNPALRTDAFEAWREARPEFVDQLVQQIALKRLGDPMADGAPLLVFLASPASDYITGMTFMLDGGRYIHA